MNSFTLGLFSTLRFDSCPATRRKLFRLSINGTRAHNSSRSKNCSVSISNLGGLQIRNLTPGESCGKPTLQRYYQISQAIVGSTIVPDFQAVEIGQEETQKGRYFHVSAQVFPSEISVTLIQDLVYSSLSCPLLVSANVIPMLAVPLRVSGSMKAASSHNDSFRTYNARLGSTIMHLYNLVASQITMSCPR